jgi:hypothetical protein
MGLHRHRPTAGEEDELGPGDADIIWRFDMLRDLPVFPHDASNCGILVLGEQLYVGTGNGVYDGKVVLPTAPSLIVLDKRSGELLARDETRRVEPGHVVDQAVLPLGGATEVREIGRAHV